MSNTSLDNEKQGYQVYYLYDGGNWEPVNWEASSTIFLNIDKAQTFANTLKCKTKIETVYIVE